MRLTHPAATVAAILQLCMRSYVRVVCMCNTAKQYVAGALRSGGHRVTLRGSKGVGVASSALFVCLLPIAYPISVLPIGATCIAWHIFESYI
ncbi:hypothetical protein F4820DRAFT_417273 [Hypoxylon rubiginosum]|uniref:Uncharacterized protein n=1 Tax=Hypoxylon rubiginosum TaxID=110542 RepID=A0ACB9Z475_9PEZI|nr:hypothetical protein F4820DRAFT_417273 [Hypoxylon rubiginosum]